MKYNKSPTSLTQKYKLSNLNFSIWPFLPVNIELFRFWSCSVLNTVFELIKDAKIIWIKCTIHYLRIPTQWNQCYAVNTLENKKRYPVLWKITWFNLILRRKIIPWLLETLLLRIDRSGFSGLILIVKSSTKPMQHLRANSVVCKIWLVAKNCPHEIYIHRSTLLFY